MTTTDLLRSLAGRWRREAEIHRSKRFNAFGAPYATMVETMASTFERCARELDQALSPEALSGLPCGCDPGADWICREHQS